MFDEDCDCPDDKDDPISIYEAEEPVLTKAQKAQLARIEKSFTKALPIIREEAKANATAISKDIHFLSAQKKFIDGQQMEVEENWIGNPRDAKKYIDAGDPAVEDL